MDTQDTLRDDFRRFEYECPKCGAVLSEYAESCPQCGQNLFEVFSGTFRPKRSLAAKLLVLAILVVFIGATLAVSVVSLLAILRHR